MELRFCHESEKSGGQKRSGAGRGGGSGQEAALPLVEAAEGAVVGGAAAAKDTAEAALAELRDPARGRDRGGPNRGGTGQSGSGRGGADNLWGDKADTGLGGTQVEGRQAVRELLLAGRRRCREIYLSTEVERAGIIEDIIDLAYEMRVTVQEVSQPSSTQ